MTSLWDLTLWLVVLRVYPLLRKTNKPWFNPVLLERVDSFYLARLQADDMVLECAT